MKHQRIVKTVLLVACFLVAGGATPALATDWRFVVLFPPVEHTVPREDLTPEQRRLTDDLGILPKPAPRVVPAHIAGSVGPFATLAQCEAAATAQLDQAQTESRMSADQILRWRPMFCLQIEPLPPAPWMQNPAGGKTLNLPPKP